MQNEKEKKFINLSSRNFLLSLPSIERIFGAVLVVRARAFSRTFCQRIEFLVEAAGQVRKFTRTYREKL